VGFTLIELLVVIAIIAVLITLSAAAILRFIAVQQGNNTKTALTKWQLVLQNQWKTATARFRAEPMTVSGLSRPQWVAARQAQTFPQTFNEALNPTPLAPLPNYQKYLNGLGITTANTNAKSPNRCESSACLLLALQRAEGGAGVSEDDLTPNAMVPIFDANPGGPTIKALVDPWGVPVTFCRAPAGRTGLTIVSSGPDKQLGLNPLDLSVTNPKQASDNVYSTDQ